MFEGENSSTKRALFLAMFLVLFFLSTFYGLSLLHQQREKNHLEQVTEQQRVQLQSVIYSLEKTADVLFDNLFDNNDTAEIMSLAGKATSVDQDALRQLLREKFSANYGNLQKYGIDLLHFHLPGSVSFLRFQNPAVYGDSLSGVRHSIDLVNETRRLVHGFEEGRIAHGFRNVYPLFYRDEFVGTVEISFTFLAVRKLAVRLFPAIHTLMLREDVVLRAVPDQERERYTPCLVSPLYLKERKVAELIQRELPALDIFSLQELKDLNKELRHLIGEQLVENKPFSLARKVNGQGKVVVVSFLPARNVRGEYVGYFVSYWEDPTIQGFNKRHRQDRFVVFLIALASLIMLFFYCRQNRRRKKYQALATVDGLTGLANRSHFDLVLGQAIRRGKRINGLFSLVIFDIDDFKKVNDTHGHDAGDKVLIYIAGLVGSSVREQDLVARWGGEEFVVFLPGTGVEDASLVAEKLRQVVKAGKVQSGAYEIRVTCSFGVAQYEKDMLAVDLLRKADKALYRAKAGGKDCVVTAE